MPGRLVLLDCSPRVAPGCLTSDAWDAVRSAAAVFVGDSGHPQLLPLAHAGITARVHELTDPTRLADALLEAATDGLVVWMVGSGGDPELTAALASRLVGGSAAVGPAGTAVELEHLLGSYDVPGSHVLDLVAVMDRLRSPGGCPWDAEQTHESLVKYLVEEAYEVVEAVETGDRAHLREELGDVLLQAVFHARVAAEHPDEPFTIDEVADGIVTKLVRRHPHVFADGTAATATDVEANWEQIKAAEKGRTSILDGIPPTLPALSYAEKVLVRADRTGQPLSLPTPVEGGPPIENEDDLGAALLQLVAAAHRLGLDPEAALRRTSRALGTRIASRQGSESAGPPSTPTSRPAPIQLSELPDVIRRFLEAHAASDVDAALTAFSADAVVTDEGQTFRGTDEILRFLTESGAEFTYTTELLGAERTTPQQWVATNRIEGDFPGGTADLRYRFTMSDGLVSMLQIGA